MKDNFLPVRVFMGSVTNVSNRPFRRLVTELGADATLSEMVIAHYASHGGRQDLALMKRGETEKIFGIQLVGGNPSQLDKAAQFALDAKPDFIDDVIELVKAFADFDCEWNVDGFSKRLQERCEVFWFL